MRSNTSVDLDLQAEAGRSDDSNIVADGPIDILGTVNPATVEIRTEPFCRAAVDLSELTWEI